MPSFARGAAVALAISACASAPAPDDVAVEIVEHSSLGLDAASLTVASGIYGPTCAGRSGAWSVRLGGTSSPPGRALSVVSGDRSCVLFLTGLSGTDVSYDLVAPRAIGNAWSTVPAVTKDGNVAIDAKISDTEPPRLSILVSDGPRSASASLVASRVSSLVATSTATINDKMITIAKPAGTQAGMVMVAAIASENGKSASLAGWTSVGHDSNAIGLDVLYKVATAAEPASYTFQMSGSCKSVGGILTLRTSSPKPVDGTEKSATWTAPSVAVSTGGSTLIACWANVGMSSQPPSGMTEQWDLAFDDKIALACSTETLGSVTASGTRTAIGAGERPSARVVVVKP